MMADLSHSRLPSGSCANSRHHTRDDLQVRVDTAVSAHSYAVNVRMPCSESCRRGPAARAPPPGRRNRREIAAGAARRSPWTPLGLRSHGGENRATIAQLVEEGRKKVASRASSISLQGLSSSPRSTPRRSAAAGSSPPFGNRPRAFARLATLGEHGSHRLEDRFVADGRGAERQATTAEGTPGPGGTPSDAASAGVHIRGQMD